MVTLTAITRREIEQIKNSKGWLLTYGRRKVGKAFISRTPIETDELEVITPKELLDKISNA